MMKAVGICESLSTRYHNIPETKSYFRGKEQIQGVWLSPEIEEEKCLLAPYGFTLGDHKGIIIDIPMASIVGADIPKIVRPKARHLQSRNPKTLHKYISYLEGYLIFHQALERLHHLYTYTNSPTIVIQVSMDKIDKVLYKDMLAAEA
eukprot:949564-Ditylum_brightwellii.AAC.1